MKINITTLVAALLLILSPQAFAKSVTGKIVMDFDLSEQPTEQETQLWIPYPTTDEYQKISAISLSGNYAEAAVYTDIIVHLQGVVVPLVDILSGRQRLVV